MGFERGHESGTEQPSTRWEERDDHLESRQEDTRRRPVRADAGYVGSMLGFLIGGIGLLVTVLAVPLAVLLGATAIALWSLLAGLVSVGLVVGGAFGMGKWDYYGPPPE